MGTINYMLFNIGFKGSSSLAIVRFPTRARNLVNSWAKHRVRFIFCSSEELFEGFERFEYGFKILLSQKFCDVIGGALDVRKREKGAR